MLKTSLVEFQTEDRLFLPGLLYEPEEQTNKVLITLHGNGSSSVFYGVDFNNTFAKKLTQNRIAYFPFNNRGAHYIKKLRQLDEKGEEKRVKYGMQYEVIKECIFDIEGALDFLSERDYSEFYLIGFSTGANKICVYNYYQQGNRVKKYILAGGGDDTGILYDEIGNRDKFFKYLEQAKQKIAEGKGMKKIPKYILDYPLSYQSFYDTVNPDGDYNIFPFNEYLNDLKLSTKELFREYKTINKPTLVVYGENDEYCYGDVEKIIDILKKETPNPDLFDFETIKEADHGFNGGKEKLTTLVADWL